jgi:arylsulfatase A-like enzyme
MARRFLERGVRFVQVTHSDSDVQWDQHANLFKGHGKNAAEVDKPIAGLLKDLKSRGLLDSTLVVWGGEFGRTPMGENRDTTGRNHHIDAFTMWFAGGGVKAGQVLGKTDELGFNAVENPAHVHDIHATMLHLLGLDHKKLTFRFQGRDFRLTDVHGELVTKLFA